MIPFARMIQYGRTIEPNKFLGEYRVVVQNNLMSARGEMGYCTTTTGDIYALGGVSATSAYSNGFWRLRAGSDTWEVLASFPAGNRGASSMAYDPSTDTVYTFGGASGAPAGSNMKNDLYKYNITSNTWSLVSGSTGVPPARIHAGMLYIDGKLWLYGNYFTLSGATELFSYDIATNAWSTLADSPRTMAYGSSLINTDEYLYALGVSGSVYYVMRYNIAGNTWEELYSTSEKLGRMVRFADEAVILGFDTGILYSFSLISFSAFNTVSTIPSYQIDCNIFACVNDLYILSLMGKGANGLNSTVYEIK